MSVTTVSSILQSMHNLYHVYLKRGREFDSDYCDLDYYSDSTDLGFVHPSPKRLKLEAQKPRFCDVVRLAYVPKGLDLSDDVIEQSRYENTKRLLMNKKLHLVLDLDHTLLNSVSLDKLSPEEEYLKTQTQADHSLQHVNIVHSLRIMTKLRPYIRTFLVEASQMYELSIYTMGSREYALEMAKILDPGNQIFGGRVISRSDSSEPDRKCLDILLARDSAVVILDDTKEIWANENQDNVVVMPRYHFFRSSCQKFGLPNSKPFSELKTDECNRFGGAFLAGSLQLLKCIHAIFFNEILEGWDVMERDVRPVLKILKKEVLKDCKIVFSHVFPSSVKADTHSLWKMAEQLGATCTTEVDESVTHVVAANPQTQKSYWAIREEKFLVNPQWIHIANLWWQKQPEDNFPCH